MWNQTTMWNQNLVKKRSRTNYPLTSATTTSVWGQMHMLLLNSMNQEVVVFAFHITSPCVFDVKGVCKCGKDKVPLKSLT